jgi:hypothetical protein
MICLICRSVVDERKLDCEFSVQLGLPMVYGCIYPGLAIVTWGNPKDY